MWSFAEMPRRAPLAHTEKLDFKRQQDCCAALPSFTPCCSVGLTEQQPSRGINLTTGELEHRLAICFVEPHIN